MGTPVLHSHPTQALSLESCYNINVNPWWHSHWEVTQISDLLMKLHCPGDHLRLLTQLHIWATCWCLLPPQAHRRSWHPMWAHVYGSHTISFYLLTTGCLKSRSRLCLTYILSYSSDYLSPLLASVQSTQSLSESLHWSLCFSTQLPCTPVNMCLRLSAEGSQDTMNWSFLFCLLQSRCSTLLQATEVPLFPSWSPSQWKGFGS